MISVSQGLSREDAVRDQETTAHIEAEVPWARTVPGGESLIWDLRELCHKPDHDPDVTPGEPMGAVQGPEACIVSSILVTLRVSLGINKGQVCSLQRGNCLPCTSTCSQPPKPPLKPANGREPRSGCHTLGWGHMLPV